MLLTKFSKQQILIFSVSVISLVAVWGLIKFETTDSISLGDSHSKIESELSQAVRSFYIDNTPLPDSISFILLDGLDMSATPTIGYHAQFEDMTTTTISTGTVEFNGRRLPAAIVQADITYVNRIEGTRKTKCYWLTQADDDDFQMQRDVIATNCDGSSISLGETSGEDAPSIADWKNSNDFKSD